MQVAGRSVAMKQGDESTRTLHHCNERCHCCDSDSGEQTEHCPTAADRMGSAGALLTHAAMIGGSQPRLHSLAVRFCSMKLVSRELETGCPRACFTSVAGQELAQSFPSAPPRVIGCSHSKAAGGSYLGSFPQQGRLEVPVIIGRVLTLTDDIRRT